MQGTTDTLFPLDQASEAFAALRTSGVPVKMMWYCGGHVACESDPGDPRTLARAGLAWLNRWLRQDPSVDTGPPFRVARRRRRLALRARLPARLDRRAGRRRLGLAEDRRRATARCAASAAPPARRATPSRCASRRRAGEADIVGNPRVRLVYRGRAKPERTFLYAQIVDGEADRVLGGLATPLPVILDGRERTVARPLEAIAEHGGPASLYRLQITPGAATYELQRAKGRVSIYGAFGSLPLVDATRSGYGFARRTPTRPRVTVTSRRRGATGATRASACACACRCGPVPGSITFVVQTSRRPYVYNAQLTPRPCRAARKVTLRARRGSRLRVTATFNGNPELKPRDSRTLSRNAR